jgi:hypothetical protein
MNIHQTILDWAKKTDPKIEVSLTFHNFIDMETCLCTRAFLRIKDEVMQKSFLLDIVVPHERRSIPYLMGPEIEEEMNDPIEYFVPDFSTEKELGRALDVVHKRFLTEYGGQRFDDPAPDLAPDILATAKEWAEWKNAGITVSQKDGKQPGSVLVFIPSSKSKGSGTQVEIHAARSVSQNLVATNSATLNAVPGYLPPFFTASELRGALEIAFDILKLR